MTIKKKIKATLNEGRILTENSDEAKNLNDKNSFGTLMKNGRLHLSFLESAYLIEKGTLEVLDGRGKEIEFDKFVKKARKTEPNFWVRYCVFQDIRNRGYIIKTALKFGADFRVYERGVKPGEDHAKWVVYAVNEGSIMTWYEFAAKNRVAHSTKKKLMIGIVDDERDVTYYEVKWTRP
ncbi:MAG: tRNA-intron lyase [Sulfurovaceae bacterium]|nr:tRNA-intron lyase [Sulfurovaceae bacterium]